MFISQVSFSTEKANEEVLRKIMKKKMGNKEEVVGFISSECWRKEGHEEVSYTMTSKWESKESFKTWISRPEHVEGHKKKQKMSGDTDRPAIKKTINQYELVDIEALA